MQPLGAELRNSDGVEVSFYRTGEQGEALSDTLDGGGAAVEGSGLNIWITLRFFSLLQVTLTCG